MGFFTAYQVLNIILTILTWSVQAFKERFIDMQLLAPGESSLLNTFTIYDMNHFTDLLFFQISQQKLVAIHLY